jgi:hypothetical protein
VSFVQCERFISQEIFFQTRLVVFGKHTEVNIWRVRNDATVSVPSYKAISSKKCISKIKIEFYLRVYQIELYNFWRIFLMIVKGIWGLALSYWYVPVFACKIRRESSDCTRQTCDCIQETLNDRNRIKTVWYR